jgi:60kDa lysophospholipase
MRLSQPVSRQGPAITITDLDDASQNAAATWSWTAAEASSTETVLLPFLIHLASARNDVESIRFCIGLTQPLAGSGNLIPETPKYANIPGGMVNCLEPGSGRSPLHIAAFNGHLESVNLLLQSGALVHLRDALGHTALYYVRLLHVFTFDGR